MITYKLNSSGDIFLEKGTIATVISSEETAQDVKTKLKTVTGEVFYNVDFGVPYFSVIFAKPFDKDLADSIIIQTIYSSPNVVSVDDYQSSVDTVSRLFSVDFTMTYNQDGDEDQVRIQEEFAP